MGVLRVRESFTCFRTNPYGDDYPAGTVVDEKHPAVQGRRAQYFEEVEATDPRRANEMRVEQATAAPGESRYVQLDRYQTGPEHPRSDPPPDKTVVKADGDGGTVAEDAKPKKRAARKRAAKKTA